MKISREKQCVCTEFQQRNAVCLYRILAEKSSMFIPIFDRERRRKVMFLYRIPT